MTDRITERQEMNPAEQLHMALLNYEHPWIDSAQHELCARDVCRAARALLRQEYGLDGDWPADKQPENPCPEQRFTRAEWEQKKQAALAELGECFNGPADCDCDEYLANEFERMLCAEPNENTQA